jgi:CBS domain-containing protein
MGKEDSMQLRELMTQEVEIICPDATLQEAAQQMRASNIGAVPVCEGNQIVGILTERDLMAQVTAEARDPKTTRVREVMTPEPIACFEDQESTEAIRLMRERQLRHLAVLSRDQRLVGIVSLRDVAMPSGEERLAGSAIRWPA